jgi:hypothetical protein
MLGGWGSPMSTFRRVSCAFGAIILVAPLVGCFDNVDQDHAACKLKALEVYKSKVHSTEYEEEQAYYVQICMEAAGYRVRAIEACGPPVLWSSADCFSRNGD